MHWYGFFCISAKNIFVQPYKLIKKSLTFCFWQDGKIYPDFLFHKTRAFCNRYDTLYACVSGNTVKNVPIESSVKIILPDLKRYDSLLKGGDTV